jgi:hypothetical protein
MGEALRPDSMGASQGNAWRAATRRSLLVVALLIIGIVTVRGLEAALHATFDKPPLPPRKELSLMKKTLGSPVRYEAAKPDEVLEPEVVEALGTTYYLVREYRNIAMPKEQDGSLLNLNVNYYDTGSSTPHVPETCWAGSGREEVGGARNYFDVKGVRRSDGSTVDLRMKMISFTPPRGDPTTHEKSGKPMYTNVAYVFQVNGHYVASTQEVTSQFWKAAYRFAYHAKIEVTPLNAQGRPLTCTQEQAQQIVSDFMREALCEVEECLPDPAIVTGEPAPQGQK